MKEETLNLKELLEISSPFLREIVFHSDGSVVAKTGGKAKFPKKLYKARPKKDIINSPADLAYEAVFKLYKENI